MVVYYNIAWCSFEAFAQLMFDFYKLFIKSILDHVSVKIRETSQE